MNLLVIFLITVYLAAQGETLHIDKSHQYLIYWPEPKVKNSTAESDYTIKDIPKDSPQTNLTEPVQVNETKQEDTVIKKVNPEEEANNTSEA